MSSAKENRDPRALWHHREGITLAGPKFDGREKMVLRFMMVSAMVGLAAFLVCLLLGAGFWLSLATFYGVAHLPLLLLIPARLSVLPEPNGVRC